MVTNKTPMKQIKSVTKEIIKKNYKLSVFEEEQLSEISQIISNNFKITQQDISKSRSIINEAKSSIEFTKIALDDKSIKPMSTFYRLKRTLMNYRKV